ncbi:MAG TPA: hypothetical protein VKU02_07055 [Gemmataceae bacterium]|nr:hypothetical protein [Gemmataceae bacterium]
MKRSHLSGAIVLLALALFIHIGSAAEENVQGKVVAAWRARERDCAAFKIKWKETQTFVKGSLTNSKTAKHPKGQVLPPETMEAVAHFVLCVDGEKMKEISDAMEVTQTMDMKRQEETAAFNGEINKSFRPAQIQEYPQGFIGDEKYITGLNVYNLRPVLVPFRPFRYQSWGYFSEADLLKNYATIRSAIIDAHRCIVLRETGMSRPNYKELWLDPEREYIPLREVMFARGKPYLQIDWEEYRREALIWVPVAWKIQELNGGIMKSVRGTVVECTINQPIPAEEFEIEFPSGTWVIDRRSKDRYGTPSHYILKDSGKRMISAEELNSKTYQQLNAEQRFTTRWTLAVAASAAALLVIALVLYRRNRHVLD